MKDAGRKLRIDLIWFAALLKTFPILLASLDCRCQDQHNILGLAGV